MRKLALVLAIALSVGSIMPMAMDNPANAGPGQGTVLEKS